MKSKEKYLTLAILRDNHACQERYDYLVEKLGTDFGDDEPLSLSRILEINGIADCFWAFNCFSAIYEDELRLIATKTAVWSARQALKYFTEKYPDDDRPRKAIEAAEAYIENASARAAYAAAARAARAARAGCNIKSNIIDKLKRLLIEWENE